MADVSYKNNYIYIKCTDDERVKILQYINYSQPVGDYLVINSKKVDNLRKDSVKIPIKFNFLESYIKWKKDSLGTERLATIRVGVINSRIIIGSKEIPDKEISDACKYFFKPAVRQERFKNGHWDGYIHLYQKRFKIFPTGLLDDILSILDNNNIKYNVQYTYDRNPKREFDWSPKEIFKLSDDQEESINVCMEKGRCSIKAATGFGKSAVLARYLTALHAVPTLFIANKKVLLDDAGKDFIEGIEGLKKEDVVQIKDGWFGNFKINKDTKEVPPLQGKIVLATIQSLAARLKDVRTRSQLLYWLKEKCKFLMVDETQSVGTSIWDNVLSEINAPYRVFLSATPKRTDGATLKIFAYSGPLAFDTSGAEQIEKGRLCDLDIQYHYYDHKLYNENDHDLIYADMYRACIVENNGRNEFIVKKVIELLEEERQVLLLIQFIEHGELLRDKLLEFGLNPGDVKFIFGKTSNKNRQQAIDEFRIGNYKVLIGSTIADAGLNIPSVSGVVMAGAGNSDITLVQRIGRGSRTCDYEKVLGYIPKFIKDAGGEKVSKIIDIMDDNICFFKKQAFNRYFNAKEEFGASRVHLVGVPKDAFRKKSKQSSNNKISKESEAQFEAMKAMFNTNKKEENSKLSSDTQNFIAMFTSK